MASSGRRLRSGFTTGACAAAAAKAAVMVLTTPDLGGVEVFDVEIPFPGGSRVRFSAFPLGSGEECPDPAGRAMVIKDGGDDPDVTNGARIVATARIGAPAAGSGIVVHIIGGEGVGRVTKPGLSVPVGEAAITAVPRTMITEAVAEVLAGCDDEAGGRRVEITVSVPEGEALARKTLNGRLGILGGISILGTSGIVRPLSAEAWTATITASMDVAAAGGIAEIVLSTGRVSEKAHMRRYGLPEEAYVMMGDYVAFSLAAAAGHGFRRVHIAAQWAKMLKISMATPETHVRHGAIDPGKGMEHLRRIGVTMPEARDFNTAREIYEFLSVHGRLPVSAAAAVCGSVKRYAEGLTQGVPVSVHLVSYEGDMIIDSE